MFRVYEIPVVFNEERFSEVWIDPHYEEKHGDTINDELILSLLARLSGKAWATQMESKGFYFFEVDLGLRGKFYRLILVVPPDGSYLGVRNVYRRKSG
jgi:hypothetical protein